ncbi:MAG TPA: DNA polymerase III subunit delta' [Armatimonadota bacterium]|jgi:DNA polymerase-3 subunit delta'
MKLSDILAQDSAVRTLRASISRDSVAHAYLFTGPRGTGKTSAAIAFAAALNCADRSSDADPCDNCISCIRIQAGTDADVRVIQPDGNQTKIGQMQEMIREMTFAPLSGRHKVIIIEQADTLNSEAENAILKILEEPPHYAVLILLSRNPNSLLATIRSRCRTVRFRRASTDQIADAVRAKYDLPEDEIKTLAACSQGAVGIAYSLASDPKFMEDRRLLIHTLKTWADGPAMLSLQTAEVLRDMAKPPKNNTEGQTSVKNLNGMLELLLAWYSDLLKLKVSGSESGIINVDFIADLCDQSSRYTRTELHSAVRAIMTARRYLEGNITPQSVLENLLFDLHP